jgi:hypothetical protein
VKTAKTKFDEECSKLSAQRKQDKLQWLQNPSHINGNNMNTVRCETIRTFRNKRWNIRKRKLISLKDSSTTLIKDKNGALLTSSHNILICGRITSVSY